MKKFFILAVLLMFLLSIGSIYGQLAKQESKHEISVFSSPDPSDMVYAPVFTVQEFKNWYPESDPNAAYNRSSIPLNNRIINDDFQINDHARPNEAGISPLVLFKGGSIPSQSVLNAKSIYAYSNWQYADIMCFWGGQAPSIVNVPAGSVVDAAHRNGVPIVGNIFFPPSVFGGEISWVWEFLEKYEDGTFPVADKLIEAAEYYGFDGWFINQETEGGNKQMADLMVEFMKYFKSKSELKLYWYDSMINTGQIYWQEELNENNAQFFQDADTLVSENMFLDFGWNSTKLSNSRNYARDLARSEYDLFAGINIAIRGPGTSINWDAIFPEDEPHVMSLGLYRPDDYLWHQSEDFVENLERESEFWVGQNGDPGNTETFRRWKGLAHYVPAHTAITSLPFFTNFNFGAGFNYFIDGIKSSPSRFEEDGWNNLSVQDILPTWKWNIISNGEKLLPEFTWEDAYHGGNSLKISGNLTSENILRLYKTNLLLPSDAKLELALKRSLSLSTNMSLALAFTDAPDTYEFINAGNLTSNDWELITLDLSAYNGRTIGEISLKFENSGETNYSILIGRIGLYVGNKTKPNKPTGLFVERKTDEPSFSTVRLKWNKNFDEIQYYNIYKKNRSGNKTYLGGTSNNAFFVPFIDNPEEDSLITVEVVAIGKDFSYSDPAEIQFEWFAPPSKASNPNPANLEKELSRNITLSWLPGAGSTSHDIYIGTQNPPPFAANTKNTNYKPSGLEANTTYYWRIDEKNKHYTTAGDIWEFTTNNTFVDTSGYALLFNGFGEYVNCGNDESLQISGNNITIEAYIKANEFKSQIWAGVIVSKDGSGGAGADYGYSLRCGGDGQIDLVLGNGSWTEVSSPAGKLNINKWHHIAGSYDGSKMRLYIDGREVAGKLRSNLNFQNNDNELKIGESTGFSGRVFDGTIDEVRIWNVTRTSSQIKEFSTQKLGPEYYITPDSGLVGYWQFDEGEGQKAHDLSYYANDGILGSTINDDSQDPEWVEANFLIVSVEKEDKSILPLYYELKQNYPNPFNPKTNISFSLPENNNVEIVIFNVLGAKVETLIDEYKSAGYYTLTFNAGNLASGIYIYTMRAGNIVKSKKLVVLK